MVGCALFCVSLILGVFFMVEVTIDFLKAEVKPVLSKGVLEKYTHCENCNCKLTSENRSSVLNLCVDCEYKLGF